MPFGKRILNLVVSWMMGLLWIACHGGALDASAAEPEASTSGTVLGIQGTQFTLNGEPTFLLGFSYYAGLGASPEFLQRDLNEMQHRGFNWLRVWATWGAYQNNISAFDEEGNPRSPYFEKLRQLVSECDRRGMVVDVTLARHETAHPEDAEGLLPNAKAHRRAVELLIEALKSHRNWYLDLANERDVGDARFVSIEELKQLRKRARELNPRLLVTASHGGHDLSESDIREMVLEVGVDFISPHRPRHAKSPGQTRAKTEASIEMMKKLGRLTPVQYQEPFRRGYTQWQPKAADFLTDLRGAVEGGAAGWCFHNGGQRRDAEEHPRRSFDLRKACLIDQMDDEEEQFIRKARTMIPSNP